jgi:hypothetical protein
MDTLTAEAKNYVLAMWNMVATQNQIEQAIQRYDDYYTAMVPADAPSAVAKYIHKERMLYDKFMNDEIIVFCYDPNEDDDAESFYSDNTFDDHSSQSSKFLNGVRTMDESDFRDQLGANEFVGGYWDPTIHWVLPKEALTALVENRVE